MAAKKHFFQDRTALLLVSANAFLALIATVLILLKLNASQGTVSYIVSYRSTLGIDVYGQGGVRDVLSFILATVIISTVSLVLAYRTYDIKRELSLVTLALTLPLLTLIIIVSNALLVLR